MDKIYNNFCFLSQIFIESDIIDHLVLFIVKCSVASSMSLDDMARASLFVLCVGGMCITSSQPSRKVSSKQNCDPINDLPPKYSDVIITQESAFNKYKNKGRELLAKIYIIKE